MNMKEITQTKACSRLTTDLLYIYLKHSILIHDSDRTILDELIHFMKKNRSHYSSSMSSDLHPITFDVMLILHIIVPVDNSCTFLVIN